MNVSFLYTIITVFLLSCSTKETLSSIERIEELKKAGYDIIDFHAHLKGGLTMEDLILHSDSTGIDYGVAVNCGKGFPVENDSALSEYYRTVKNYPFYTAVQAEGREWMDMVSQDTVNLFDYTFTDAMTWTDSKGRRTRLWMKDEVWVENENAFMEELVGQIETIFSSEPVDIYVNPTFLPEIISDKYDALWTDERIYRMLDVLSENKIAMEINARYRLPSEKIIKMAKERGIKFTMGTNNADANLGTLDYCLEMIANCNLQPTDFWMPK
jgi:hypothetical protein